MDEKKIIRYETVCKGFDKPYDVGGYNSKRILPKEVFDKSLMTDQLFAVATSFSPNEKLPFDKVTTVDLDKIMGKVIDPQTIGNGYVDIEVESEKFVEEFSPDKYNMGIVGVGCLDKVNDSTFAYKELRTTYLNPVIKINLIEEYKK